MIIGSDICFFSFFFFYVYVGLTGCCCSLEFEIFSVSLWYSFISSFFKKKVFNDI